MLENIFDALAGLLGIFIAIGLMSFPVMWLWNSIVVSMFGLPTISYIYAAGLMILCDLLFKGNIGMNIVHGKNETVSGRD